MELELRHIVRFWYCKKYSFLTKFKIQQLAVEICITDYDLRQYDLNLEYDLGVLSRFLNKQPFFEIMKLLFDTDIKPRYFDKYTKVEIMKMFMKDFGLTYDSKSVKLVKQMV